MGGVTILPGPTISAGTSLSPSQNPGKVGTGMLVGIITPPAWDPAPLTFQWSFDNITFYDIFERDGTEAQFVVRPNTIVAVASPFGLYNVPYVKLRSGARSSPINQSADRVFSVIVQ